MYSVVCGVSRDLNGCVQSISRYSRCRRFQENGARIRQLTRRDASPKIAKSNSTVTATLASAKREGHACCTPVYSTGTGATQALTKRHRGIWQGCYSVSYSEEASSRRGLEIRLLVSSSFRFFRVLRIYFPSFCRLLSSFPSFPSISSFRSPSSTLMSTFAHLCHRLVIILCILRPAHLRI